MSIIVNVFVKPKDPRKLAHLGLARKRLLKTNVFVKPKDPRELAHLGLARTFVQVRAEAKLAWIMPNAAESRKANALLRTFAINPKHF